MVRVCPMNTKSGWIKAHVIRANLTRQQQQLHFTDLAPAGAEDLGASTAPSMPWPMRDGRTGYAAFARNGCVRVCTLERISMASI
jgi:hypothetical protein